MSAYKVGARIRSVVPDEPEPLTVVIDDDGLAWQNRPGPDDDQPWKSTAGRPAVVDGAGQQRRSEGGPRRGLTGPTV